MKISDDLLMAALDFFSSISSIEKNVISNLFNVDQLIPALLESISQIMGDNLESHTKTVMKSIENWLSILAEIIELKMLKFEEREDDQKFKKINEIFFKILRPYIHSYNLIPLDEQTLFCIRQSVGTVLMFQRNDFQMNSELIWIVIQIMSVLISGL